ncbi:MAG: transglutaminase family protein [Bacteroidia bacterium]|nr:transglutaminase family protein [Bacteroidia bacterium]
MSIQVAIRHHTKYSYDKPVQLFPQTIRLRPAPHTRSPIRGYSLKVQPGDHFINWQQDPFGNYLARLVFAEKTTEFVIDVEVIVDMVTINPFDFFLEEYAEKFPFTYDAQLLKELSPYLEVTESGPLLASLLEDAKQFLGVRSVDFLVNLNQKIREIVNYTVRLEPGIQTCEETLSKKLGSCRDSAWLLVQTLRSMGLAARFVSGYLIQLKADAKPLEGPSGPEADFTDLHAWAEVYLPGAGWVGLDATSGLFAGEGHIPLACTPDPSSAAPVTGFTEPCKVTFDFKNVVDRIWEQPRVTRPFTPESWEKILSLGDKTDTILREEDVRLTMGGEPTFVSADDMESEQWNETADGKDKRKMAYQLAVKLKNSFGPGGFLHLGQGKWYPGEPIPRWQYSVYWRKDEKVIWKNPDLFADPNEDHGLNEEHARKFIFLLANYLGISSDNCIPAYEDVFYFLWEEGNLPMNVDPLKIDLKDKLERKTLSELLERGLNRPKGYTLPLRYDLLGSGWKSCHWEFSRKHLFLIPGNSAIGMRLPLDRLPYLVPEQSDVVGEPSPLEDLPELPGTQEMHAKIETRKDKTTDSGLRVKTIKTALCIEPREGNLYIFLPPLESSESVFDLLASIEKVAEELHIPIILEGYQLPYDYRIHKLVVAPDPGVIEVNIHPAHTWRETVSNYEKLFDLAKTCRLGTEKFMLDGKHTGTGGGNHITLGGARPADSPFLRRPDLLRSFVNFWQNHPGLSYLFSSAFVGTTSQAPRVDEGRQEMLYELDIAFRELDRYPDPPAWMVDRIFRNLLIDITGNTHRAEFCIDKLFSPDSQSGRLGIVEMRGFDMPPHLQMCLTQILLIRSLVAIFWKNPYRKDLIRWGTELHDKFLIHHFVKEDLKDVVRYLHEHDMEFQMEWLDAFFEFRFPVMGKVSVGSIHLTIRAGIEPWNVLGEEMSNTGTARFVDSSVERVEVMLEGIAIERYQLLCNQTIVPLTFTGTRGKYVAGIRYKAWNPPSALHPTLGVDVPLVFDIYDTWNQRSVGGCTYHVSHPGGRSYDTFPVNSYEAESRRGNRFWEQNHTPRAEERIISQTTTIPSESTKRYISPEYRPVAAFPTHNVEIDPEFPYTLDLRKNGSIRKIS